MSKVDGLLSSGGRWGGDDGGQLEPSQVGRRARPSAGQRSARCLGLAFARAASSRRAGDGDGRPGPVQRAFERNAFDRAKTRAAVPSGPRLVAGRSAARIAYPIVNVTIDLG